MFFLFVYVILHHTGAHVSCNIATRSHQNERISKKHYFCVIIHHKQSCRVINMIFKHITSTSVTLPHESLNTVTINHIGVVHSGVSVITANHNFACSFQKKKKSLMVNQLKLKLTSNGRLRTGDGASANIRHLSRSFIRKQSQMWCEQVHEENEWLHLNWSCTSNTHV